MNYDLFELINSQAGRYAWLDGAMKFAAVWVILLMVLVAAVPALACLRRRALAPFVRIAAALLLAFVAGQALARLNSQVRPFQTHQVHQLIPHDPGVSLPSDHATAAFALAFAVTAFLSRGWGLALIVMAALIGFSRIWVGVHYPGDILAGALVAGAAVGAVLFGEWYARSRSRTSGERSRTRAPAGTR